MDAVPVRYGRIAALIPAFAICAGLGPALLIMTVHSYEANGPSMQPAVNSGDRFIVDLSRAGLWPPGSSEAVTTWSGVEVGDVVVVVNPMDNLDVVKRVVGVGGDRIELQQDGLLIRNGEVITQPTGKPCPTNNNDTFFGAPGTCLLFNETLGGHSFQSAFDPELFAPSGSYEVPHGSVFVLGDRRDRSNDSRRFGPVPMNLVKGVMLFKYWQGGGDE